MDSSQARFARTLAVLVVTVGAAVGACTNTVAPATALSVVITPSSVTSLIDQTIFLSVAVKDASNASVVPDSVGWTSSDTTRATVSAVGVLRTVAVTSSAVTIQATAFKASAHGSGKIPVMILPSH